MSIQYRATLRNARMDAVTTDFGNAALIRIYDGTPPANPAASLSGNTLLAELTGASPFAAGASSGVLTASAITQDSAANAGGTASFYRVYKSDGTTCCEQGTVTATGGGGDMTLSTVTIVISVPVQITSWVHTEGNA